MQTSFACVIKFLQYASLNHPQMAIYHLCVKTISRSSGRSATAAAAYRCGVKIVDQRTGEVHDYRRKRGIHSSKLILPSVSPSWSTDRSQLWNAIEQAEKRKNSTVAREFEVALPSELSVSERERLAHDFAQEIVTRHRCVADVAIHAPSKGGDSRNHHAHILLSTRRLDEDGFGEKTREFDDQKIGPQLVADWRERFAELQNERLREAGLNITVDHRTLAKQGVARQPSVHLGPSAVGYERRTGLKSRRRLDVEEQASERLQRARDEGQLALYANVVDRSIIDLSSDLQAAKRERDERLRFERMGSTELEHEMAKLRAFPFEKIVKYKCAERLTPSDLYGLTPEEVERKKRAVRDFVVAVTMADRAPILKKIEELEQLHQKKLLQEQVHKSAEQERLRQANQRQEMDAALHLAESMRGGLQQILAKIAAKQQRDRQLQDRQAQEQLRLEEQRQLERLHAQVREPFLEMARLRAHQESGWEDGGMQWQAASAQLRHFIERYNAYGPEVRLLALEMMLKDDLPREQLDKLVAQQKAEYERQVHLDRDDGPSM